MREPKIDAASINNLVRQTIGSIRAINHLRAKALAKLGLRCVTCGFADIRALQIDHIHGNGAEERRQYGKAAMLIISKKIIDGSTDYQILCANCNTIKACENKERGRRKKDKLNTQSIYYDLNGVPR